jgi:site-specific DNA-adenine methylase
MERTKPFLKWAGGKFKLVDRIAAYFPKHPVRYMEPLWNQVLNEN